MKASQVKNYNPVHSERNFIPNERGNLGWSLFRVMHIQAHLANVFQLHCACKCSSCDHFI